MSLPDYTHPPLTEVVFGVAFKNISSFKVPHIGAYWNKIHEEFPNCEQRPPFASSSNEGNDWPVPLPLIWFISDDYSHLIQLQNGYFYLNWRRQSEETEYPRFENLKNKYFDYLSGFVSFLEESDLENIQLTNFELTYINHIHYNHLMKSPKDIGEIFPDINWKSENHDISPDPTPQAKFNFELTDNLGQMQISIKPAQRAIDGFSLYVMEINVKGTVEDNNLEKAKNWFNESHEWIIKSFADMTSEQAQRELWGRL